MKSMTNGEIVQGLSIIQLELVNERIKDKLCEFDKYGKCQGCNYYIYSAGMLERRDCAFDMIHADLVKFEGESNDD